MRLSETRKKLAGKVGKKGLATGKAIQKGIDTITQSETMNKILLKASYNGAMAKGAFDATNTEIHHDTNLLLGMGVGAGIAGANYVLEKYIKPGRALENITKSKTASYIRTGILTAAVAGSSIAISPHVKNVGQDIFPEKTERKAYTPTTITFDELKGRTINGLYSAYLGQGMKKQELSDTLVADFDATMKRFWKQKKEMSPKSISVPQMISKNIEEYTTKNNTKMTLEEYVGEANKAIENVREDVNWEKVKTTYHLDDKKADLLKELTGHINGKEIMAYGMTELFPLREGVLNTRYMNKLLQEAGREYIENLPAMADSKLSFGLFQFTEYALYDKDGKQRGASKFNKTLQEPAIEGSVISLKNNDHFKAAYLFAAHNLARLIETLDETDMQNLKNPTEEQIKGLTQFIATSHHAPNPAISMGKTWVAVGANKEFEIYTRGRLEPYAEKTKNNYKALVEYMN